MHNLFIRTDALFALRATLNGERERLASTPAHALEFLTIPQNVSVDDQIPLLHDQFVALNRHDTGRRKLVLVMAALERFERGEYGICEDCGGEISLNRLRVIPWASRCVPCQGQFESRLSEGDADAAIAAYG